MEKISKQKEVKEEVEIKDCKQEEVKDDKEETKEETKEVKEEVEIKDCKQEEVKEDKQKVEIKVKYFEGATELETIEIGDWIDCYSREEVVLRKGDSALIKLGFAMQLPEGFEAHLAPRSSTFKKWGVIQTNSVGVIDNSYCGDDDEWKLPVYCLEPRTILNLLPSTLIKKGDKICQFRIMPTMKSQLDITITKVDSLGNDNRGGFGSTGSTK